MTPRTVHPCMSSSTEIPTSPVVDRKRISIVAHCYNEEENIEELHERLSAVMAEMPHYDYEIVLMDNASVDGTQRVIRERAAKDPKLKAIFNVRNFGHIRSPYHGILQAEGDAVVVMASDLEDPPELIPHLLREWERGFKVVAAVRRSTEERGLYPLVRRAYYSALQKLSEVEQVQNYTGFGVYDRRVVSLLRQIHDPYPYLRGLVGELGFPIAQVPFDKPYRRRGISKGTFYVYLDMALLGIVNHSKLPLRIAALVGFGLSAASFLAGGFYLIRKLLYWDTMQIGIAPVAVGLFFIMGVVLAMLGLVGEYVALIVTHILNRPIVVEKERLNFEGERGHLK
jgi:glycosyltransferase involved in cell wall biosynthesis